MPKPARSRQRPAPRPPVSTGEPLVAGAERDSAVPRTVAARPARRVPTGGVYTPPDYAYVGQDVVRILILSGALVAGMVGLSRLLS